MENFSLDNFDPTTAQLLTIAESYKGLTITKDGIGAVKEAKKDLQSKRIYISKALKADRDKAIKYQKDNIAKEKELIGIISPVEKILDEDLLAEEMKEEMQKRRESLEIRWTELKAIGLDKEYTEEFLLTMNFVQFMDFLTSEKARLFEIEQEKKRQIEAEAKRQADLKDAEERGRLEAEQKMKQEEQKKIDDAAKEEKKKQDEQAKLEKETRYQDWLKGNGYNENEYIVVNVGFDKKVLYKKVSEFII